MLRRKGEVELVASLAVRWGRGSHTDGFSEPKAKVIQLGDSKAPRNINLALHYS
jgi:hypothetical protein